MPFCGTNHTTVESLFLFHSHFCRWFGLVSAEYYQSSINIYAWYHSACRWRTIILHWFGVSVAIAYEYFHWKRLMKQTSSSGPLPTNAKITFEIQHPELLDVKPAYILLDKDKPEHNSTIWVTGKSPGKVEIEATVDPKDAIEYVVRQHFVQRMITNRLLTSISFSAPAPFTYEFWSQSRPFSFTYRALLVGRTLFHGRCHSIRKYLRISDAKV